MRYQHNQNAYLYNQYAYNHNQLAYHNKPPTADFGGAQNTRKGWTSAEVTLLYHGSILSASASFLQLPHALYIRFLRLTPR